MFSNFSKKFHGCMVGKEDRNAMNDVVCCITINRITLFIRMNVTMNSIYEIIAHLSKEDQEYILAHQELIDDIMEQQLDEEEVDALLTTSKYVDQQQSRKQITMKLPERTLQQIKIKAKQEWIPYQTLIGSVLYKFVKKN